MSLNKIEESITAFKNLLQKQDLKEQDLYDC
jgi:hypothetical protein